MRFSNCNNCGKYRYIEDDGLCVECYNELCSTEGEVTGVVKLRTGSGIKRVSNAVVNGLIGSKHYDMTRTDSDGEFTMHLSDECTSISVNVRGCVTNSYSVYAGKEVRIDWDDSMEIVFDGRDSIVEEVDGDQVEILFSGNGQMSFIYNVHQLQHIDKCPTETVVLRGGIDATNTPNWNGGNGFRPIDKFEAELFGNNTPVRGLYIDRPEEDEVGLIRHNEGMIQGLVCSDLSVTGCNSVGGIAGVNEGDVGGVTVDGTIKCEDEIVGGIVGANPRYHSRVTEAIVSGRVGGCERVGGIAGYSGGVINSCASHADVSGLQTVGGLVGELSGELQLNGILMDSYARKETKGNTEVGGVVGSSNHGSLASLYWDGDESSISDAVGNLNGVICSAEQLPSNKMTGQNADTHMDKLRWGNPWTTTLKYPKLHR